MQNVAKQILNPKSMCKSSSLFNYKSIYKHWNLLSNKPGIDCIQPVSTPSTPIGFAGFANLCPIVG